MNVKIKTVFGELSFNMTQDNALSLISTAARYAETYVDVDGTNKRVDALPALAYAADAIAKMAIPPIHLNTEKEQNAPPVEKPAPKSRVEALFGAKADWKLPPAPAPVKGTESGTETEPEPEKYKGFLYVECEECGALKGFCIKHPIDVHKCECGHYTRLHNLRAAHVKCECGHNFKYNTNIQSDAFTINCLHCGSPVDMELGSKSNAFVSIAFSEMYKQKGTKKR